MRKLIRRSFVLTILLSFTLSACVDRYPVDGRGGKTGAVDEAQKETSLSTKKKEEAQDEKVKGCYFKKPLKTPEVFSLEFDRKYYLKKMDSRSNYYAQVQADNSFGCVIFAVKQTNGFLKGKYTAVSTERQVSVCEGKQDYVYTQFISEETGKRTFRLQCEYRVYEDQLPQAFAPTLKQVSEIQFTKPGDETVRVVSGE